MPGVVGIISQRPAHECESLVRAMVSSMCYESFYVSGMCSVPELGVYGGWVAHESSFAAGQNTGDVKSDFALLFSGECFGADRDLVELYRKQEARCFRELNGLFSGFLVDKRSRKMFLFNDRYGMERIYWHESDGDFYFASEAKALLRILPDLRQFDSEGVAQFLAFGCTAGSRTLFRAINLLPGGSLWTFDARRCHKGKYFSPEEWESQPVLAPETFISRFGATFKKILPRYFESDSRIGISLTGGVDSRMIMACLPAMIKTPVCFTFAGRGGETDDVRLARQIAIHCGLEHRTLRIGHDFFSDFGTYVDRTVQLTDGYLGALGAHEIYLNAAAREFAQIRMTGNYGSEILRGVSTFKPLSLAAGLTDPEFNRTLHSLNGFTANGNKSPITTAAFREIPWQRFGVRAAGHSQIPLRTPYLDHGLVSLVYRAPNLLRTSSGPGLRLIRNSDFDLSCIPTDMGELGVNGGFLRTSKRIWSQATFKLDYLNNEGLPHFLSWIDRFFNREQLCWQFLGRHKYLHYRRWFRKELARYVKDTVTDPETKRISFWNANFLEAIAKDHAAGRKNYIKEIDVVLTLSTVDRLLLKQRAHSGPCSVSHLE
jgi:asparagine synthase (glutamine-hydrolysing)